MNARLSHALAWVVGGVSTASLMALAVQSTPTSFADVTAGLPCTTVMEQDEFARISGTSADARCDLPSGQAIRVVQVVDRQAFSGFLTAHPDLAAAYRGQGWRVVGTYAALDAAGLMTSGEG